MSDPRQEERLKPPPRPVLPSQLEERIHQGLSPCDDDLPFAQAVRQRDETLKSAQAFARRVRGRT